MGKIFALYRILALNYGKRTTPILKKPQPSNQPVTVTYAPVRMSTLLWPMKSHGPSDHLDGLLLVDCLKDSTVCVLLLVTAQ